MRNINTEIVSALKTVLPTYYETQLNAQDVPCISYQIVTNQDVQKANLNGYSLITVRVKIWAITVEDTCRYSAEIDDALSAIGHFERRSVGELTDGDLLCRIMDYSILKLMF